MWRLFHIKLKIFIKYMYDKNEENIALLQAVGPRESFVCRQDHDFWVRKVRIGEN